MTARSALTYLGFAALGAGLMYLAFRNVDGAQLLEDMQRAKPIGLAVSFVLGYLAVVSRGLRWALLLEPMGYRTRAAHRVHAVAFAYFANLFVPRSGELARCGALHATDGIPVDRLVGTVLAERAVDMAFLLLFGALAVGLNLEAFSMLSGFMKFPDIQLAGALALLAVSGLAAAGVWWQRARLLAWGPVRKVASILSGVGTGLRSILHMEQRWAFLGHTVFIWAMYFLTAYTVLRSMDIPDLGWTDAMFIVVAGGFGMVLPAPGGIGAYQWSVMLAFMALDRDGALGFAAANLMWLTQTAMFLVGGALAYGMLITYRMRRRTHLATPETTSEI